MAMDNRSRRMENQASRLASALNRMPGTPGRRPPNMERMPRMIVDDMKAQPMPGDGTARIQPYPDPQNPAIGRDIRNLQRDMQQMPRERLSPGVYRGADGSLVSQQGQMLPNQPRRDQQQPPVQNLQPLPFARDQFPQNENMQYYQPPPQDVYIGRGMSMPIPQRRVPVPLGMENYYGNMLGYGENMTPQQIQQLEQNLQNTRQGMQQGRQQFPWSYPLK